MTMLVAGLPVSLHHSSRGRPVLLLDGGTGQELVKRGLDISSGGWSAVALEQQPELVTGVHSDFLTAGADIIIANSYAATARRYDDDRVQLLNRRAGELASAARDKARSHHGTALVAGSLPPLFGSYEPEKVPDMSRLLPLYRQQACALAPYVDFFVCETLSTAREGRAAASAALETGLPTWVSWTLSDVYIDKPAENPRSSATKQVSMVNSKRACLRSGETIQEAVDALEGLSVSAYLVNCCTPEAADVAMPELAAAAATCQRAFGAYPNAFESVTGSVDDGRNVPAQRTDLDGKRLAKFAEQWIKQGATIVGGCCDVSPAHISQMHNAIGQRTKCDSELASHGSPH